MPTPLTANEVTARLESADVRLRELLSLTPQGEKAPRLTGADASVRLRLMQEFFFHLIGAVEVVSQIVDDREGLGLGEEATIRNVCTRLAAGSAGLAALGGLCQQTRSKSVPADPYSEDGLLFRALVHRHNVTHRHMSPFLIRIGGSPPASLPIDPRIYSGNYSDLPAEQELKAMLSAVRDRCVATLKAYGLL